MDKKRREDIKTMILISLVFFGINYSLFTFIITPKINSNDEFVQQLEAAERNHSVQEMKELEKERLLIEVEESKTIIPVYNEYISESIDTISMTVDVYDYIVLHNGLGINIGFDMSDILSGIESKIEEAQSISEVETDVESFEAEPIVAEIVETTFDKTYIREGKITIALELPKPNLESFLDELDTITSHYVNINQVNINVVNQNEEDKSTVVEISEIEVEEVEVDDAVSIIELENEKVQVLKIEIVMTTFVADGDSSKSNRELYEFYNQYDANDSYEELFDLPVED